MLLMPGTGFTMTENEFVALKGGTPLSVTTVVIMLLVLACNTSGVQAMIPVLVLMVGTLVPVTVLEMV